MLGFPFLSYNVFSWHNCPRRITVTADLSIRNTRAKCSETGTILRPLTNGASKLWNRCVSSSPLMFDIPSSNVSRERRWVPLTAPKPGVTIPSGLGGPASLQPRQGTNGMKVYRWCKISTKPNPDRSSPRPDAEDERDEVEIMEDREDTGLEGGAANNAGVEDGDAAEVGSGGMGDDVGGDEDFATQTMGQDEEGDDTMET
ncbi:hypothetical protein M427DRAFT_255952 [Gonapodya prolifera JEL478]|uniref:Uncharacterized protein n=1 Tax=Gonapodya prolifera (strain JEL478) TaxID=1344416 RepID=A0A139ALU5_GONPJ|nr:hypothetical protein M427DRAFT_255952 [Gonapodya prolifera JEL478]|eukprot:KXS17658.1 hypothetical protein M427DRAFT_255952 [Gonapodya prolifera JEL478]